MDRKRQGEELKKARLNKGLSKMQVCRMLGYKSTTTINHIELGRNPIPVDIIDDLARIYGLKLSDLLDLIKTCDPNVFKRYKKLEKSFFARFVSNLEKLSQTASITILFYILCKLFETRKLSLIINPFITLFR